MIEGGRGETINMGGFLFDSGEWMRTRLCLLSIGLVALLLFSTTTVMAAPGDPIPAAGVQMSYQGGGNNYTITDQLGQYEHNGTGNIEYTSIFTDVYLGLMDDTVYPVTPGTPKNMNFGLALPQPEHCIVKGRISDKLTDGPVAASLSFDWTDSGVPPFRKIQ